MSGIKVDIQKYIFQIRHKPSLSFYEKMFRLEKIFKGFDHWQTDRLKIILRDYIKKHSLQIAHDSTSFESDKPNIPTAKNIINIVSDNFDQYSNKQDIQRVGCRYFGFISNELNFNELNSILKLKFFSKDLMEVINNDKTFDHSVVFKTSIDDMEYRIRMGPIAKSEIPRLIEFNAENHLDPNSPERYSELSNIYANYPNSSFFFDIDIYDSKSKNGELDMVTFQDKSHHIFTTITNNLRNFIFEVKLK